MLIFFFRGQECPRHTLAGPETLAETERDAYHFSHCKFLESCLFIGGELRIKTDRAGLKNTEWKRNQSARGGERTRGASLRRTFPLGRRCCRASLGRTGVDARPYTPGGPHLVCASASCGNFNLDRVLQPAHFVGNCVEVNWNV